MMEGRVATFVGPTIRNTVNILIGCTGSVASVKVPLLVSKLISSHSTSLQVNVRVVATEKATHFFDGAQLAENVKLITDELEWNTWKALGDPILHIDLRRWADIFVIAPLDANTLGKIASGICDNVLTCIVRAWDQSKPLLFCPAMNVHMWDHPVTSRNILLLKDFGYYEIPCIAKNLACGDMGMGAMAEVDEIVKNIWLKMNVML